MCIDMLVELMEFDLTHQSTYWRDADTRSDNAERSNGIWLFPVKIWLKVRPTLNCCLLCFAEYFLPAYVSD